MGACPRLAVRMLGAHVEPQKTRERPRTREVHVTRRAHPGGPGTVLSRATEFRSIASG